MSLSGTCTKPSGSGANACCLPGWPVAVSVASVRPWKDRRALTTSKRTGLGLPGPLAGELDGAFVGLRARVGEEDPHAAAHQPYQLAREFRAVLDVVEVAHVDELAGLLGDRRGDRGMGVPQVDRADPRDEVQVLGSVVVVEAHALAADEQHRLAGVGLHDAGRVVPSDAASSASPIRRPPPRPRGPSRSSCPRPRRCRPQEGARAGPYR